MAVCHARHPDAVDDAAQKLAYLRTTITAALGSAVAATEDAISREHTMWMVRR